MQKFFSIFYIHYVKKFAIYRAIAVLYFLMAVLISFTSVKMLGQINVREFVIILIGILYFVCFALLISIFNFYKEPVWKKIAIGFFILGNILFNVLAFTYATKNGSGNFILLVFYTPVVISFLTLRNKAISPLAQSFAYIMLVICLLRIALPYARQKADLSSFMYFFNIIFLMPSIFIVALFHKMVSISANVDEEEMKDSNDLL